MKLKEFTEQYHMAPLTVDEFAAGALQVEDDVDLSAAGQAYLDAQEELFSELERCGVEIG